MKSFILALSFIPIVSFASVTIENSHLGSGNILKNDMTENNVTEVYNDVYHTPQYMPGYPTAATIWSRVIEVNCDQSMKCEGYNWKPEYGRGEYLFFTPKIVEKKVEVKEEPQVLILQQTLIPEVKKSVKKKVHKRKVVKKPKVCK